MSFLNFDCCADNCCCLHLSDFRISNSKTASTMSHHRVELMKRSDDSLDLLYSFALSICKFLDVSFICRNELMKRRIQETDGNRVTLQSLIQLLEVVLLIRQDLVQSSLSGLGESWLRSSRGWP